jgi:uncharacterized protein YicC (UPF0701 family)
MTGYGTAAAQTEALQAAVTVRSLNHRYLDVSVHLPRRLQALTGSRGANGVRTRCRRSCGAPMMGA